jgi:hypothetical protein
LKHARREDDSLSRVIEKAVAPELTHHMRDDFSRASDVLRKQSMSNGLELNCSAISRNPVPFREVHQATQHASGGLLAQTILQPRSKIDSPARQYLCERHTQSRTLRNQVLDFLPCPAHYFRGLQRYRFLGRVLGVHQCALAKKIIGTVQTDDDRATPACRDSY